MFPAFVGGTIGGVIGAAIWAAVAYFFQYEIGWIAWGIGTLVGLGVLAGNRGHGFRAAGMLAAGLAVMSIAAGKYAAVRMFMPDVDAMVADAVARLDDDEFMTSALAFDRIAAMEENGETVAWPEGVEPALAETAEDFPPKVWQAAAASWTAMTEDARSDYRARMRATFEAGADGFRQSLTRASFFGAFGPMDLLFVGLAVMTAFRIGARTPETAPVPAEAPVEA